MQSKPAVMTGLSALLLTSAAPVPLAAQRAIVPPDERYSPVRCHTGEPDVGYLPRVAPTPQRGGKVRRDKSAQEVIVTGSLVKRSESRDGARQPSYAPPPPPPPMVAPMAGIVSNFAAPYGSRQNTERYDGKAVASIQSVAAAPVSTFSVDVDTGSYSNVRRFLTGGNAPRRGGADRGDDQLFPLRLSPPRRPRPAVQRDHRRRADAVESADAAAPHRLTRLRRRDQRPAPREPGVSG